MKNLCKALFILTLLIMAVTFLTFYLKQDLAEILVEPAPGDSVIISALSRDGRLLEYAEIQCSPTAIKFTLRDIATSTPLQ